MSHISQAALVSGFCLSLVACAQPQFQTAGIEPGIAARCKLMAVSEPDRTMYTHTITGSLLLSSALNANKEEQIYAACIDASRYH